jgi:DNA-binding NtrC family response regulator
VQALARWIAEQNPSLPVILRSGSAGVQKPRAGAGLCNVTDVVPKPCARDVLERLVRTRITSREILPGSRLPGSRRMKTPADEDGRFRVKLL